jgi:hypothetical protein
MKLVEEDFAIDYLVRATWRLKAIMATAFLDLALWTSVLVNTIIPAQFSINKKYLVCHPCLCLPLLYFLQMSGFKPRVLT